MHNELIYTRREWRKLLLVPVEPIFAVGRDAGLHGDDALYRGLLRGHRTSCGRAMSSRGFQKNREFVFVAQFSVHAEEFARGHHAGHVHIKVCDRNVARSICECNSYSTSGIFARWVTSGVSRGKYPWVPTRLGTLPTPLTGPQRR